MISDFVPAFFWVRRQGDGYPTVTPVASVLKSILFFVIAALADLTVLSAGIEPPSTAADFEASATSGSRIAGAGFTYENVNSSSYTTSLLRRWQIGSGKWYQGVGLKAERFSFTSHGGLLPSRLQDYAAQLSLERFEEGECVASLTVSPGLYFEKYVSRSAWDIPFEAFSGIPISDAFNGVVGLSNGRFYHHAVPVAGLVWQITPQVRIEAVYPAPALVVTTFQNLDLRFGGDLVGGGFRTDSSREGNGVVEYDSYRVGATANYTWQRLVLMFGAGVEMERNFDFFHQGQRLHGSGAAYGKLGLEWTY